MISRVFLLGLRVCSYEAGGFAGDDGRQGCGRNGTCPLAIRLRLNVERSLCLVENDQRLFAFWARNFVSRLIAFERDAIRAEPNMHQNAFLAAGICNADDVVGLVRDTLS